MEYQNKHYNINQKNEGTQDDRGRGGETNYILMIKEQETRQNLQEHGDDDDDESSEIFVISIASIRLQNVRWRLGLTRTLMKLLSY